MGRTATQSGQSRARKGYVSTRFGDVYYNQTGSGPSLLLIHQSAQTSDEFDLVAPVLARNFCVTVIDLPGHGRSDTPPRELKMQEYSDAIIEVLTYLTISQVDVVGHHGGGALAIDLATRYSGFVGKMVVVGLGRGEELDIEALLNSPMTRDLPVDAEGEFLAKTWSVYRKMSAKNTPPEITYQPFLVSLQQRLRPHDMHHAAYRWDYYKVIHKVDKPILFLKAEEDAFAGDTQGLSKKVKLSKYQTIAGGGTWIFHEQPKRCAELIKAFIQT